MMPAPTLTSLRWQKSTYSDGGNGGDCVELAASGSEIRLREGAHPAAALRTRAPQLNALLSAIRAGHLAPR